MISKILLLLFLFISFTSSVDAFFWFSPTRTPTPTSTQTPSSSTTPSNSPTVSFSSTPSFIPSFSATPTRTSTGTSTVTPTKTSTASVSSTPAPIIVDSSSSVTPTQTVTPTSTTTTTASLSSTPEPSFVPGVSRSSTSTSTPTPSLSPTSSSTPSGVAYIDVEAIIRQTKSGTAASDSLIIGVVIAGVCALAVVVVVSLFIRRHRNRQHIAKLKQFGATAFNPAVSDGNVFVYQISPQHTRQLGRPSGGGRVQKPNLHSAANTKSWV